VRSWQVWPSPSCIPPFEDFVTRNEPRAQRVASANADRTSGLLFDAIGPAWLRSALGETTLFEIWPLKNSRTARFISSPQISERPSSSMPQPRGSGPTSPRSHVTSGSVGSLRPNKKPPESAASRLALIRCTPACAGHAVGPDARTAKACRSRSLSQ
jgi:hypothetical protein